MTIDSSGVRNRNGSVQLTWKAVAMITGGSITTIAALFIAFVYSSLSKADAENKLEIAVTKNAVTATQTDIAVIKSQMTSIDKSISGIDDKLEAISKAVK